MKKLPKIKFRPRLQQILLLILIIAVALEVFVLYKAFYSSVAASGEEGTGLSEAPPAIRLDIGQFEKIKSWIDRNKVYELPDYQLFTVTGSASTTINFSGRENPFAE